MKIKITLKQNLKVFLNLDFLERTEGTRIKNETFIFLQSYEFSIRTMEQRLHLII